MKNFKVLHIIPDLGTGGAERLVVNLAKAFDKDRFGVVLCSFCSKVHPPFEHQLEKGGITLYYLSKHKGSQRGVAVDGVYKHLSFQPHMENPIPIGGDGHRPCVCSKEYPGGGERFGPRGRRSLQETFTRQ